MTSGTQGNPLAVLAPDASPGRRSWLDADSHIFNSRWAASALLAALQTSPPSHRARLPQPGPGASGHPADPTSTPVTGLVCLENTHNRHGGTALHPGGDRRGRQVAPRPGVPVHLDGARIFNAAVALGRRGRVRAAGRLASRSACPRAWPRRWARWCAADGDFIAKARRMRKLLGGGMRQVGVLAAAGSSRWRPWSTVSPRTTRRRGALAEGLATPARDPDRSGHGADQHRHLPGGPRGRRRRALAGGLARKVKIHQDRPARHPLRDPQGRGRRGRRSGPRRLPRDHRHLVAPRRASPWPSACWRSRTSRRISTPTRAWSRAVDGVDLAHRHGRDARRGRRVRAAASRVTALSIMRLIPQPPGQDRRRPDPATTAGTSRPARRAEMRQDPRQRDLHDLPGADDLAEPGLHHRRADRRGHAPAPGPRAAATPWTRRSRCSSSSASRRRAAGQGVPAPDLRRHAAARDDRHGAGLQPEAADRRRADHRARRHHPGPDPRPAARAAGASSAWRSCSSPTTSASSPRPRSAWS